MDDKDLARRRVINKVGKQLVNRIKTHQRVIGKLETQLEQINRLPNQQELTTLQDTLRLGLWASKKLLAGARQHYQRLQGEQASSHA